MKLNFKNADKLSEAIAILMPDLGCEVSCECEADVIVTINETDKATVSAELNGKRAEITYGGGTARFCRGLAMLVQWIKDGKTSKAVTENPIFTLNGAMMDMSRNAVMNVETVKFTMRKMALMGMNCYMLYTEDTYEIDGRPYFGYMRGAYTKDEIRELDAYALKLGIELIPCIQMLGHLATHLRWSAAGPYKDTANALLAGADETYKLIDDMLKTISECFTTKRIHIGMDETHDLGTGAYLSKNGYHERQEIYFSHLAKINEMIKSYGMK
nr:family 20 glycosylhydrolase [Clostridia bacterium]